MDRDERIRFIFRKRRRFTRTAAAQALGRSVRWVEDSRFSPENGGWVSWQEMILMANLLWTHRQVRHALGDDFVVVFPPLARLVPLTVQVPAYKLIALRQEARRRRMDTSEIIIDYLDVDWCEAQRIDTRVPGFLEAWHFPYLESESQGYREAAERNGGCGDGD